MADDSRGQADTDDLPGALEAFRAERSARREDEAFAASRAATLLTLVRPPRTAADEYRSATEEAREVLGVEFVEPSELGRDQLATELENLGPAGTRAAQSLQTDEPRMGPRAGPAVIEELRGLSEPERVRVDDAQRAAAIQLFSPVEGARRDRPGDPAAQLIASSLLDEDQLVQVAAAAAALRVDKRNPVAEAILDHASRDSGEIAELSRAISTNDRETKTRVIEIEYPADRPDPDADATLVHGTWSRRGRWWRPAGNLFRYLQEEESVFPHLYRGPDPFRWSGYFAFRVSPRAEQDWDRQQAADSLAWWAHRRLCADPDLIGHSYGGSLAMMATQAEKRVRGLVLLSPAIHRTSLPDPANYEQILHVTTKLDLVLLADLSAPRLLRSFPRVTERRLKRRGLTGHSATHDPRVWSDSGLTDYVREAWLPSLAPRAGSSSAPGV
jgi:pimeloyl-ACP methyl ester carboxylesterase